MRAALASGESLSVYDLADRFSISHSMAKRYLKALRDDGEPLIEEWQGKRKVWRLVDTARRASISFSTSQMLTLFLSRRVFDFLKGTGFAEDLDEIFRKVEAQLNRRDFTHARNLDRKIFDVNEAPHIYDGRLEHMDDILTALIKQQRLDVEHESGAGKLRAFALDPYTLFVYRKGLYLAGFSHAHGEVRTFALDGFREVSRRRKETFEYPPDYHPSQIVEGAFGLFRGPLVKVRIWFSAKVAPFIRRRLWHPSQGIRDVPGGIELTMEVAGTTELPSWVMSWGPEAEVLEPQNVRRTIASTLSQAASRYVV